MLGVMHDKIEFLLMVNRVGKTIAIILITAKKNKFHTFISRNSVGKVIILSYLHLMMTIMSYITKNSCLVTALKVI